VNKNKDALGKHFHPDFHIPQEKIKGYEL